MAYELKRPEDDQEQQVWVGDPRGGGRAVDSPGGGGVSQQQPQAAPTGSGFVNFDRIINANKDVATASAGKLAGTLEKAGSAGRTALTGLVSSFDQKVQAGTPQNPLQAPPPATAAPVGPAPVTGGKTAPVKAGMPAAPVAPPAAPATPKPASVPIQSPEELAAAQVAAGDSVYKGPSADDFINSDDFKNMWTQVGKSDDELALLGQQGGLGALSGKYLASGGNYTQGMSDMDAALLGATEGGRFQAAQDKYGNTRKLVDRAVGEAGTKVERAQGLADDVKKYWDGRIGSYVSAEDTKKKTNDKVLNDMLDFGKKMGDFGEYDKLRHENVVRDITNRFDPTWWIAKAAGKKGGLNDAITDGWESMGLGTNSKHVRSGDLPPEVKQKWPAVYASLSQEELLKAEQMGDQELWAFINERYKQTQGAK